MIKLFSTIAFNIFLLMSFISCRAQYMVDTTITDVPWKIMYSDGDSLYGTVSVGVGNFKVSTLSNNTVTPISTELRISGTGIVGITKYSGVISAVCNNNPNSTEYNNGRLVGIGWAPIPLISPFSGYNNISGHGGKLVLGGANSLSIKNSPNEITVKSSYMDLMAQTQTLGAMASAHYLFVNDTLWIGCVNGLLYYNQGSNTLNQVVSEICTALESDAMGNVYSFHQNGQIFNVRRNGIIVNNLTSIVSSAVNVGGMIYIRCNNEPNLLVLDPGTNDVSNTGIPFYYPWSGLFGCQGKVWYSTITNKTISISVPNHLPTTDLGGNSSICQGQSITIPLAMNKSTIVTYTDNGQWVSTTDSVLTPIVPGPVRITTSSIYGYSPDTVDVMVNPLPTLGVTEASVCEGTSYVFNFPLLSCIPSQIIIPGSYQVNVINTASGCNSVVPFTIINPTYPANGPEHFCLGDQLTVSGVNFKFNGVSVSSVNQGGTYYAYSNVGNCELADFEVVEINPNITYSNGIIDAQYSSPTPPQHLQWMNGISDIPLANGLQYIPISNGSYRLRVENIDCTEYSNVIDIYNMSLDESIKPESIKIIQTGTGIRINLPEDAYVSVYDMNGKLLYVKKSQSHTLELPAGIYVLGYKNQFYKILFHD